MSQLRYTMETRLCIQQIAAVIYWLMTECYLFKHSNKSGYHTSVVGFHFIMTMIEILVILPNK